MPVLETVDLRPDDAVDPPGPSESLSTSPSPVTPSASPSATLRPAPSAGYSQFDSPLNGISIDYPSDWQARPATEPWTGEELSFDSPAADVIFDPAHENRLYILLASQSYGIGNGDAWRNGVLTWTCRGYRGGEMWGWRVDGAYAWQQAPCNSDSVADFSGSIVTTDTRGYLIRLVASKFEPGVADYDWDWLKAVLETVDLADSPSDEQAAAALPGTWKATDAEPDRSHLTMEVVGQSDGSFVVTVHDDHASVCGGATSTMTGLAEAQHGTMVIAQPGYICADGSEAKALSGPPLDERLRNLRFIYVAGSDQLEEVGPDGPN